MTGEPFEVGEEKGSQAQLGGPLSGRRHRGLRSEVEIVGLVAQFVAQIPGKVGAHPLGQEVIAVHQRGDAETAESLRNALRGRPSRQEQPH